MKEEVEEAVGGGWLGRGREGGSELCTVWVGGWVGGWKRFYQSILSYLSQGDRIPRGAHTDGREQEEASSSSAAAASLLLLLLSPPSLPPPPLV